jgi:hypothetical protein
MRWCIEPIQEASLFLFQSRWWTFSWYGSQPLNEVLRAFKLPGSYKEAADPHWGWVIQYQKYCDVMSRNRSSLMLWHWFNLWILYKKLCLCWNKQWVLRNFCLIPCLSQSTEKTKRFEGLEFLFFLSKWMMKRGIIISLTCTNLLDYKFVHRRASIIPFY